MSNFTASLKSFFTANRYRKEIILILLLKIAGLILLWNLYFSEREESIKSMTGFQVIKRNFVNRSEISA